MKGRVGREIDVLGAAGKPFGCAAGVAGEGRQAAPASDVLPR